MATASGDRRTPESELHDVDWQAVEHTPEFQGLVKRRRAFVIPATLFFLAWYLGFIALSGYAEDFMAESVYEGLTVGYCLALTQFVMVAVLGVMYLRRAERVFDPSADKVARMVDNRGGRFSKTGEPTTTTTMPRGATTTDPEVR